MLLDTSVLVAIDRGVDDRRVQRLDQDGPHYISAVTAAEFYAGVYLRDGSGEPAAETFLANAEELHVDSLVAKKAGRLIAEHMENNDGFDLNDLYIAATAQAYNETVLTTDVSDYEQYDVAVNDWNTF